MWNTSQLSSLVVLLGLVGLSTGCASTTPCSPVETVQLPAPATIAEAAHDVPLTARSVPAVALVLERKVKLQEKRIAELSTQLRLLKRIDLDRTKDR